MNKIVAYGITHRKKVMVLQNKKNKNTRQTETTLITTEKD